ncbi:uncharacterized protein LOC130767759 [Actinidia eriantha]|uniref:uncharacterized protein LOC130767759 n=1 Tax=Actinidia eriantha TaxID=165200 RepID=UPI0025873BAD|nr:uncharacterized protein LOC130767759 [Actinidia eriantha]
MAVQAPPTRLPTRPPLLYPTGNAGLRRPSVRFGLKPILLSPSGQLLLVVSHAPRFTMRLASKQTYICRDCGYIYSDRTPFEKVSDNYYCPVCGAPKRRFRQYTPAVTKNANDTDVRKARKAQIKRDEAVGQALPFAIVIGVAALAGLYYYLNSTF